MNYMENFENEIWKPAKYYYYDGRYTYFGDYYECSNFGRVKTLGKTKSNFSKIEKELKYSIARGGYYKVQLYDKKKLKQLLVNRLIYSSFNGYIPEGMEVNHINEVKSDNSIWNLNLMSKNDNIRWGTKIKRTATKNTNGKCSKKVLQYDINGNLIKEWPSTNEIERQTGYLHNSIVRCCNGKQKNAYGYKWEYKNGE